MKNLILFLISNLIFNLVFAQPEELYRGRLKIEGGNYGHPYTTFDRYNGNLSFNQTINNIRDRIIREKGDGPVFEAYSKLYNFAVDPMPADGGMKSIDGNGAEGPSRLALWAKCNAFVFLIGLDSAARWLDTTSYGSIKSFTRRNEFRDRVFFPNLSNNYVNAFSHLTDEMPNFYSKGEIQFASRSLIHWLAAYDLLKASYEITELRAGYRYVWGFGDSDRNIFKSSPRNKLRKLTRDLYQLSTGWSGIVEHQSGWKKNHGIAAACALLMSAQVLNDAGVETNILQGNFIYRIFGGPGYNPTYSPVKWNKLGYDGIVENLFVGFHLFSKNVPQTPINKEKNSYSVYAEGIHYLNYGLLDCGLPAFRTQRNLYPPKSHEVFYNKNEILNIINWVDRLRVNHYILPTFDNSGPTDAAILSLTGHGEFNYGVVGASLNNYLVEYVAIVGGNDIEVTKDLPKDFDAMVDAGNILIRNETSKSYQTFLMLCEKETAIDEAASIFDGTHEDEDMGSWSLFVQNSFKSQSMQMVVDPPYAGYTLSDGTNKFDMHNVIQIHTLNTPNYDQYKNPKFEKKQKSAFGITEFNLVYDWKENKNSTLVGNAISRNVISLNLEGNIYYILNDFIDATNVEDFTKTTFILNGNGNEDNSSYRKTGNIHIWDYPCNLPGNWSLTTHHCSLKGGLSASGFEEKTLTKNEWNFTGSAALGISGGYLTRLKINQTNEKTIYQSFIYPQVCGSILPTIFKRDSGDFVSTTIHFVTGKDTSFEARLGKNNTGNLVNDTSCHLHLARLEGNIADSASNPFNLPNQSNKKLYFNGQKLFVNYHTLSYMGKGYKYCPPSYANFRTVKVDNGSYLIFNDTLFLSTILLDFQSTIIGRQTYSCLINPLTTATASDTIIIKLPDVGRGVEMIAIASGNDTIPSRFDSLSNYFYMSIPQGKKEFTIQEKQACQDCYFPPVGTHIRHYF
jgi:hypothetical protein